MSAYHERFADLHAGAVASVDQGAAFRNRQRDWFFAQYVLAGLGRANGPGHVQVIRQGIVNGFDFWIGQHRFVGAVGFRNLQIGCGVLRFRQIARCDTGYFRPFALLHGWDHLVGGDLSDTQNAPADFFGHSASFADVGRVDNPLQDGILPYKGMRSMLLLVRSTVRKHGWIPMHSATGLRVRGAGTTAH